MRSIPARKIAGPLGNGVTTAKAQSANLRAGTAATDKSPENFVGRQACAGCHKAETELWSGSLHDQAMQPANDQAVLGYFDGAEFTYNGVTTTFYKKIKSYFVRTDGPDGKLRDYEISYTFGAYPLQQYLIAFPGERLQALGLAWDARPKAGGGQDRVRAGGAGRCAPAPSK